MKVVFVASGNKAVGKVNSFVQSQFDSLQAAGLDMILFPVVGHGISAHLQAVGQLRRLIKQYQPDVVHAHYSICGYVAAMALVGLRKRCKLVVSILGSFPTQTMKWRLVRYCMRHIWDHTIVKSQRTAQQLALPVSIIPNGVNLDMFYPQDPSLARQTLGLESDKRYVVWCSHPDRVEKNFAFAKAAMDMIDKKYNAILLPVYNQEPQQVAMHMNAADCLLLTSEKEGSPNVIKEAMACNCPIVTTDVGDVRERLSGLDGCYILPEHAYNSAKQLAELIVRALDYNQRTNGYNRIIEDQLTVQQVAKRIIQCYE